MIDPIVISMISLTCFLIASGLLVFGFKSSGRSQLWTRLGYGLFAIGTLTATLEAVNTGGTAYQLASAIAWATTISWFTWKMELIGAFTSPVIAITLLSGTFFSHHQAQTLAVDIGPGLKFHIASAVIGQTFAILACGMSLLFLWLDKKLKNRQLSDLPDRFPAIATITSALTLTLWIGFTFITVSLLSGAMYAMSGMIPEGHNIYPKVAWAILVWAWYLSILVLKGILGYRPQKVARMSLAGFVLMAISWFGILFVAPWGGS
jgi:ABC-type uncharacterized transport system permease subunit